VADLYDQNGDSVERKDLVRLWTYWPGKGQYQTALCLRSKADAVMDAAREQGAHCWATDAVIVSVSC
jgi:hypothetical protein